MSIEAVLRKRAKDIHHRLMYPPNPVEDTGISLRNGKRILPEPEPEPTPTQEPRAIVTVLEHHKKRYPPLTFEKILQIVANHYKITIDEIKGPVRRARFVIPRWVITVLCRRLLPHRSISSIGRELNKDHSSILNGHKQMLAALPNNPELSELLNSLEEFIRARYHC